MRRRIFVVLAIVSGIGTAGFAMALDQGSANFRNDDSAFPPATFGVSSTNFQVDGSVEAIVGAATSANFGVVSGVAFDVAPAPIPPPPSGGGAGGIPTDTPGYVIPPTLQVRALTFRPSQTVSGTRDAATTRIWVNGSFDGVSYPDGRTWERDLPLFLGPNAVVVQAYGLNGARSVPVGGTIERLLIGDVNRDRTVDDVDLSLFTRAWTTYTPYADFDEDGTVDDTDLSLLASHWGTAF
ncbi:dockerin type I domain-containing protein [Candidatus Uhrbacteria bacterium]|nr:dockerin type I domain-containing protein [Candidatus Uhrbacteria bacterium]